MLNAWTIPIARRSPRRASRKFGCARGDTAPRERRDIFGDVFARRFHREGNKLQPPKPLPAVRLPGDVRCSLLENDVMRGVNGAVVEYRDPVAQANCGL